MADSPASTTRPRYLDRLEIRESTPDAADGSRTRGGRDGAAAVSVTAIVVGAAVGARVRLRLAWGGHETRGELRGGAVAEGGAVELAEVAVPGSEGGGGRWSPAAPRLHTLTVTLLSSGGGEGGGGEGGGGEGGGGAGGGAGCDEDALTVRVGLRRVGTATGRLTLDGAPLKLKGFNRHDFHPAHGAAVPHATLLADLQWVKAAGANVVCA